MDDLSKAPWDTAFVFEDTEDIVDSWYKISSYILGCHIPIKEKRVKNCAQPVWFDSEINEALKKKETNYSGKLEFLKVLLTWLLLNVLRKRSAI